MTVILSIKEINMQTFGFPRRSKYAIPISFALRDDILIRNENIISKERKTKNHLS